MRKIEIQIGERVINATLLDDKAPKLCNAIWNALPIKTTAHLGIVAGGYMFWVTPTVLVHETENPVKVYGAQPGMLTYYWPAAEIGIFYDRPAYESVDVNYWASVDNVEELELAGRICRQNDVLGKPSDELTMRRKK